MPKVHAKGREGVASQGISQRGMHVPRPPYQPHTIRGIRLCNYCSLPFPPSNSSQTI